LLQQQSISSAYSSPHNVERRRYESPELKFIRLASEAVVRLAHITPQRLGDCAEVALQASCAAPNLPQQLQNTGKSKKIPAFWICVGARLAEGAYRS
jgi:hypothetical protein